MYIYTGSWRDVMGLKGYIPSSNSIRYKYAVLPAVVSTVSYIWGTNTFNLTNTSTSTWPTVQHHPYNNTHNEVTTVQQMFSVYQIKNNKLITVTQNWFKCFIHTLYTCSFYYTTKLTGIDVSWLLETFRVTNSDHDSVGRSCELTCCVTVTQKLTNQSWELFDGIMTDINAL